MQTILSQSAGYLLSQAHRLLRAKVTEALEPLKLSLNEYVVLRLAFLRIPLNQGSLGELYGIDPSTMVFLIDGLEQADLLIRERNSSDRRRYQLVLTAKGNKVLTHAKRIVDKTQRKFLEPLDPAEWDAMRRALGKLIWRDERPNN